MTTRTGESAKHQSEEGIQVVKRKLPSQEKGRTESDHDGPEAMAISKKQKQIRRTDEKTSRNFQIYRKVTQKITLTEDVQTLGIYLGCDPYDIEYHLNKNQKCPRQTAYQILLWMHDHYSDEVDKWMKLIHALTEMGKNKTVAELRLQELRDEAMKPGQHGGEQEYPTVN